jgi:hypothetical protein
MRGFLILIFLSLAVNLCYGFPGKPVRSKAILQTDTSTVNMRHFDAAALKVYSKQPEFQYRETTDNPSWWTRFWRWFWQLLGHFWQWLMHLFDLGPEKNARISSVWLYIFKYLFITLGIGALVFLILKLAGVDMLNIFSRKSTSAIPYSEFFEDIHVIDFDAEIENAVSKHNYRFAVRLLYLKCLKQLSDAGLITWQIDKTNSTYINELVNDEQRTAFKMLTRQFEYVWYGEFLIDGPIYKNIDLSFRDFNKRVA